MTLPPTSDADPELVRRCIEGDDAAWAALTGRYADLVYGIARRNGLSIDAASDTVQEVFLALLKGLKRLRRTDRLLAWVVRAARRESWRQARRGRSAKRREREVARPEADPARPPDEDLAAMERTQTVREAFAALGDRCRRLLDALLLDPEGASYADLARELGLAVGSLGSLRRRCLTELRDELLRRGFTAPG